MAGSLYALILAGGSGSRLWPLSRELHPKQLMKIEGDYTLFQAAFIRLVNCVDDKNILSVTNVKLETQVRTQLKELQEKFCRNSCYRVVTEPESKNTAPAIAVGIKFIEKLQDTALGNCIKEDPVIIAVPSDSLIGDEEQFAQAISEAVKLARENYIVCFGVKPTRADSGLGYIKTKRNKKIKDISMDSLKVESFIEKPDKDSAQEFVDSGKYYWNSGMFVFKSSVMLAELKKYEPDIFDIIKNAEISSQTPTISYADYEKMPDISIDYSVIESTKKLAMVPLDCEWKDVGSWDGIYDISQKDENGNYLMGNVLDLDSKDSMVYSTSKLITTIGLESTVVVETEDAVLVCDREHSNDVKKIVSHLKERGEDVQLTHRTVYRPWGYYTVLTEGKGFLTKCIYVNPGAKLSVQLHHHRSEHWVVVEGKAMVLKGEELFELHNGESVDIEVEEKHSLQNPFDEPLQILEIQQGDILDENDIVRFEDMYGRV
ncbi:MAG: mannose-1-phosphate guanylyltransferase/mannose-6-phosphate isomerase [Clostridium sp.]|nr:mannose-1-phosphate guanylyltransferase/mannose-6-phosphate isomerase [Clostridium sp.]